MMRTELSVLPERQLDQLVQAGYDQFSTTWRQPEQTIAACNHWLEAWELVKQMTRPEMRTDKAFEAAHPRLQYPIGNWLGDLEMELHNAGLHDPRYFEHRIRFVHEYLAHFPDVEADDYYVTLRRAEGEALWLLGRPAEAEAVYQALIEKLPDHAWGYIGWADQYTWGHGRPLEYERAEALLRQALERPNLDDRKSVLERLIDLYTQWDRLKEIPLLQVELIEILEAEEKTLRAEIEVLEKNLRQRSPAKLGRNEPCWCGSGKKYKICHLRSDKSGKGQG
jgi:tetratricopeptide (TPR) repeat protein